MRIWTLHPRYLDAQGLTALWRESLLARAVLRGQTRGYRHHPQLLRFKQQEQPLIVLDAYLQVVHAESMARGYRFDDSKFERTGVECTLPSTDGQLALEWRHLMHKLQMRNPAVFAKWEATHLPDPHPLFKIVQGPVESWERS